ncbi:Probable protein S-acyltransferase 7 [Linum perenne]
MCVVSPSQRSDPGSAQTDLRVYQTWKDSNIFFLNGRFIFGSRCEIPCTYYILIVAPVAVFCVFVARKLMVDFPNDWGISITIVVVVFTVYRNYKFFFMFTFSTTLLCIYVFAFSWVYIRRIMSSEDITIWKAMIKTPASIVLIIYTFISMWFVRSITAFHLYLISTNQVCVVFLKYGYGGGFMSPNMGKAVEDIEMGRKTV